MRVHLESRVLWQFIETKAGKQDVPKAPDALELQKRRIEE
jgi:hypothetical protein